MSFMQPQVRYSVWAKFVTSDGLEFVDAEEMATLPTLGVVFTKDSPEFAEIVRDFSQYLSSSVEDVDYVEFNYGWGARMTAPGYMDCTDWSVFPLEAEARKYLDDYYGDSDG